MTVGTGFIAPNRNAAPKDRMAPRALCGSKPFDGFLQSIVHQVSVDLGGRNVLVTERPLDHKNIGGGRIQVGSEGVAQTVRADSLINTGLAKPVFYAVGHLPRRQARPAVGEKQRRTFPVTLAAALFEITAQEGAKIGL